MASSDARPVPKKNVAYRHYFAIRKNDGTLITTWAGQDTTLSKDGASFVAADNEATEIGTSGKGFIDLTAAEMNFDAVMMNVAVSNTDALVYVVTLFPEEAGDIRTNPTQISGSTTAADNVELAGLAYSVTRGLSGTALPAAVADESGGLPISDAGGLDIDNRMPAAAAITRMNILHGTDATYSPLYSGPRGPGVYLNDAAGNTNTVAGTDGTFLVPVSTIAAAKTLADGMGMDRIYLVNDSDITLAATMVDYEFVGIGEITANVVNLGSQDVSNSCFWNVNLQGTQGGSGRICALNCALADPGAGATTLHIFATACGIVDQIEVDTSADNVFDQCFSLVAGPGAPIIIATGASGTISVRHHSGGMEFKSLSASHNISYETDGQVIFNADCNVNATVVLRGNMEITDNTAGMNSLTQSSALNMGKWNLTSSGNIGIDWANVENQGATVDLSVTTIFLCDTVTTNTDTAARFVGITVLAEWLGLMAGNQAADATALSEIQSTGAGAGTYSETDSSLESLRARGDTAWLTATGFSTHDAAAVYTAFGTGSNLSALVTATGFGTAVELAKVPKSDSNVSWNATALAAIEGEANDALEANHLDHLFKTDYDPASKPGLATALLNELVQNNGSGVSQFTVIALDRAPSGSGGDATLAKQNTIISTLATVALTGADSDTLKTLSDQIDTITGGTGDGARTVAVTVNDGAAVLENATVRFTEGANTYAGSTDASGELSFSLDDATYAVAISKAGYTFTPTTLVVDGDKTPTYSMSTVSITAPPTATTTTGTMTVLDQEGSVEESVSISVQILAGPGDDGLGYDSKVWVETSNASGVVEFAGIVHGARYKLWRGEKANSKEFTAPTSGVSFDLVEIIGRG